jgi:hypothetical protein
MYNGVRRINNVHGKKPRTETGRGFPGTLSVWKKTEEKEQATGEHAGACLKPRKAGAEGFIIMLFGSEKNDY